MPVDRYTAYGVEGSDEADSWVRASTWLRVQANTHEVAAKRCLRGTIDLEAGPTEMPSWPIRLPTRVTLRFGS